MRYVLIEIDKTIRENSREYIEEHIIESLDEYFSKAKENFVEDLYELYMPDGSSRLCLNINDVANKNAMLIIAYNGKTFYGAHRVSYVDRIKG